jgi:LPS sulfotransferase NodH
MKETPFVEPARSYVICCVQRAGSWLLAHTLADTGYAGRPSDDFDEAERETRTREWGLRPDQEAEQPAPDVEQMVQLVQFAQRCEDGWRQRFASTGLQPCEVRYEDLPEDRLAVANAVLEFLRLPRLEARDLPPVRYRKQADTLTERYVDLVRSAMTPRAAQRPAPGNTG